MQDAGPVSNDGERTGHDPSGRPPRERATRNPYGRSRERAHGAPEPVTVPEDDAPRPPAVPRLLLVPAASVHPSVASAASGTEAIAAAGREPTLEDACVALVDGVTGALDLGSAHLYVLEDSLDGERLRLVAHTGGHSAFMVDAPTIALDADLPVVRALLEGTAAFEADPHGLGDPTEGGASGVGRWRAAIGAQAEAFLPLLVGGRGIGVLTLTWRVPRAFGAADRRELELLAAAAALAIDPLREVVPASRPDIRRGSVTDTFAVDGAGRLTRGGGAARPTLRIAAAGSDEGSARCDAFTEVAACTEGRTAVVAGVVRTAGAPATARASEAGRLLCGWLGHGLGPVAALKALAAWGAREGEAIDGLDAVACILDTGRRCVTYATTGHALAAMLADDGRFFSDAALANVTASSAERVAVLLPGDRLALWSGDASGLAAGDGPGFVHDVIADPATPSAERAAVGLIGSDAASGCAAEAAIIVDVVGPRTA